MWNNNNKNTVIYWYPKRISRRLLPLQLLGLQRDWDDCDGGNKGRGKSGTEPRDVGVDVDIKVEVEVDVDVEVEVDVVDIDVNGGKEFSHGTANP